MLKVCLKFTVSLVALYAGNLIADERQQRIVKHVQPCIMLSKSPLFRSLCKNNHLLS